MIKADNLKALLNSYKHDKLGHAYLLETNDMDVCFGDLIEFLKQINCMYDYNNCNKNCNLCTLFDEMNLPSLIVVEPDGQAIKKEQILNIIEKFSTKPVYSKYNMYIIKGAERFNNSSANTLLKFLEEPEDNILCFLITNNRENILSTIKSRCQVVSCFYDETSSFVDVNYLDEVKIYLNSIYQNSLDLLYNKTEINKFSERIQWEQFFLTMYYYFYECFNGKRIDKIDMLNDIKDKYFVDIMLFVKEIVDYIKSNVNIDLVLDKFVIGMRKFYE